jgi:hypothetical protein
MHIIPHLRQFFTTHTTTTTTIIVVSLHTSSTIVVPSPIISQVQQGIDQGVVARSTIFISDVAFEVASRPFNVRETFGDDVVLIHISCKSVLTNQWGVTLHSLQHSACHYLI